MIKEIHRGKKMTYFACESGVIISKSQTSTKVLKPIKGDGGYVRVHLPNGLQLIHRLIAMAFKPNPKNLPCVNHLDGNKENCAASNLEWATYSENEFHAIRTGLKIVHGENNHQSKLNEGQVLVIKQLLMKGMDKKALSQKYGVSITAIRHIENGRNWSYLNV